MAKAVGCLGISQVQAGGTRDEPFSILVKRSSGIIVVRIFHNYWVISHHLIRTILATEITVKTVEKTLAFPTFNSGL